MLNAFWYNFNPKLPLTQRSKTTPVVAVSSLDIISYALLRRSCVYARFRTSNWPPVKVCFICGTVTEVVLLFHHTQACNWCS